jgi:uncharacterized protein with HEPN domain
MSKRVVELFLFDIYIAILKIEEVSKEFSNGSDLKYDFRSWDTIIREFEIIGEAMNNLIKANYFSDEYKMVVNFRNILIHKYFGIDEDIVLNTAKNLKPLKTAIINKIDLIEQNLKYELVDELQQENQHLSFIQKPLKGLK